MLPVEVGDFLRQMKKLRTELPKGKERMAKFDQMTADFFAKHFS
jgi:precorrin-2 dehydrogenase/sirohydrochlorin ferrochelatase